jgi:hypothetical protein
MKIAKKTFLQITVILVVSFFYGINAFSNLQDHRSFAELSTSSNTLNSTECSESELFEDVHITRKENVFKLHLLNNTKLLFIENFFILLRPSFSIWQPPELI